MNKPNNMAQCERRAIEIYVAAPPEKLAKECRVELIAEFGEECVHQMLKNGIGNNNAADESAAPLTGGLPCAPLQALDPQAE